jgi:hypothetical protein
MLAICVVYLVTPGHEGLLDLHLARVARHTRGAHVILGVAVRMDDAGRRRLEAQPGVRLLAVPPTALRGSEEHAYYLDRLVERAVAEGAERVAILHVDSFPVRDGWDEEMAGWLTPACPVAAVCRTENLDDKPHPCGMMVRRDFIETCRPTFRLTADEMGTAAYRAYARAHPHEPDSGVGYGFRLYRSGLAWRRIPRSNKGEDHAMLGSVYGGLVFHLGAAARKRLVFRRDRTGASAARPAWLRRVWPFGKRTGPDRAMDAAAAENRDAFERVCARLLADPEGYLTFLSTGRGG